MSRVTFETMADVLERLGGIAPKRVRMQPQPGKATERDLLRALKKGDRLFELVDGTLVEKVMGWMEACLALRVGRFIGNYAAEKDLGEVAGADAATRLMPGLVRIPDCSFVSWERLPGRALPDDPIPGLVPDLAVEVLREGNTPGEIRRKLKEYFLAGVPLVWLVDPRQRTVQVFTAPDQGQTVTEDQVLGGGAVLPGLRLPLRDVFARVPRCPAGPAEKKRPPRRRKPDGSDANP
jgi:Uma2 family endonuclease